MQTDDALILTRVILKHMSEDAEGVGFPVKSSRLSLNTNNSGRTITVTMKLEVPDAK